MPVVATLAIEKGGKELEALKQKIFELKNKNPDLLVRLLGLCREYRKVNSILNEGRRLFAEQIIKFPVPVRAGVAEAELPTWERAAREKQFQTVQRLSERSGILSFSLAGQSIDPAVIEGQKKQDRLFGLFIEMPEQGVRSKKP